MEKLYSDQDLADWTTNNAKKIAILQRRIGPREEDASDAQGLNLLSLALTDCAFESVARGDLSAAKVLLSRTLNCKSRMLSLTYSSQIAANYRRTAEFQTLLVAYAIRATAFIDAYIRDFNVDTTVRNASPEDSSFFWDIICAFAENRHDRAVLLLAKKPSHVDPQFAGLIPCFESLAAHSTYQFAETLQAAERDWYAFAKRKFRGHPQCACFLLGTGLVEMARIVLKDYCVPDTRFIPQFP